MIRAIAFNFVVASTLLACASSPTTSGSEAHAPITAPPQIVVKTIGEVTIHTFISPPEAFAVTSHAIETKGSVVVIDTQLLSDYARRFRDYIKALDKPIDRVLISHGHPDHYFGIEAFDGLPIYALPKTRHDIGWRNKGHWRIHKKMEGKQIADTLAFPDLDLSAEPFTVDGVTFELEAVEACEDNAQLLVRLPAQRVLVAQDLAYNGYHPFFMMGDLDNWQATLRKLAADTDYDYVLAGHGAPGTRAILTATADYLEEAREALAAHPKDWIGAVKAMAAKRPELRGAEVMLTILGHFKG